MKKNNSVENRFAKDREVYLEILIKGLVEDGVLESLDEEKRYRLTQVVQSKVEAGAVSSSLNKLISDFLLFRSMVNQLIPHYPVDIDFNSITGKFSTTVSVLLEDELFGKVKSTTSENLIEISKILEDVESLSNVNDEVIEALEGRSLSFNPYINNVLEDFTFQAVKDTLSADQVEKHYILEKASIKTEVDVLAFTDNEGYLLFDVKFRRRSSQGLKDSLYQLYELLQQGSIANTQARVALVLYTTEEKSKFKKTRSRFENMAKELFPGSHSKFSLFIVPVLNLDDLYAQLKDWKKPQNIYQFEEQLYMESSEIIQKVNSTFISSDFVFNPKGSVSVWVRLLPINSLLPSNSKAPRINNMYVIGYASNKFAMANGKYLNAFAIRLFPNASESEKSQQQTSLRWNFWVSNSDGSREDMLSGPLENSDDQWSHLFVRWNHSSKVTEFYVDGMRMGQQDLGSYWPTDNEHKMAVGSWGNDYQKHLLNMHLFRLQISNEFLSDSWLKEELDNKPI